MSTTRTASYTALALLVLAKALPTTAQNQPEYFKISDQRPPDAPTWSTGMYAPDPDVFAVDAAYAAHYRTHAWRKDYHVRNYLYWRQNVGPHLTTEGRIRPATDAVEAERYAAWTAAHADDKTRSKGTAAWTPIGPFGTYKYDSGVLVDQQANVESVAVSPTNPDYVLAGTEGSGVYLSTDHGATFRNLTYDQPFSRRVQAVAFHPDDERTLFAGANKRIYRSEDAGDTWTETGYHGGSTHEFKFHPTNPDTIWAPTSRGLFKSEDGGDSWLRQNWTYAYDLEFKPGTPTTLYLLDFDTDNRRSVVRRSTDAGATWHITDDGYYRPTTGSALWNGGKLAVTPANPELVYASVLGTDKDGDNGWIGLYHSTDGGDTWRNPAPHDGAPYDAPHQGHWNVAAYGSGYHQGFYNHDLEVSPTDPAKLWMGTIRLVETLDSGRTWTAKGGANNATAFNQHADVQDIEVDARGHVWIASDGGLNVSHDELATHLEAACYGIDASDFWGFSAGWNEDLLFGGRYHNGNSAYYQTYAPGDWKRINGVEEATGYTNAFYPRRLLNGYADRTERNLVPTDVTGRRESLSNLTLRPSERVGQGNGSQLAFDVRYGDHVYLGRDSVLYRSTDGGTAFDAHFTFPDGALVQHFAQSRAAPEVWYAFAKHADGKQHLYRSGNGAAGFTEVQTPGNDRRRIFLSLDPHDADHLWVADHNGRAVHASTDGGQTWTDHTPTGATADTPKDLLLVQTPEGHAVYLAGERHVQLYESWTDTWRDYATALPYLKQSLRLAPFYPAGKLRLATQGRGVFEAPFAHDVLPQALPMAARRELYCDRDTIQLESHSIFDQRDGATFAWDISPAPAYISDSTARNPRVVLSQNGAYDVTLAVTDADGRTSARTIEGLLTLDNQCGLGQRAGMALRLDEGEARISGAPLRADSMTIMMWVRPETFKYEMLALSRGANLATGIHVWENGELGVHHNNRDWWIRSGLLLDSAAWNHVAVTFAPDGARLYLNGEERRMTTDLTRYDIAGDWHIGGDPNSSARRADADFDEVSFWDRPLSKEEIRRYRHLTLDPARDEGLAHYYQFDVPALGAYDLAGRAHGIGIIEGAFEVSDAPVGGGTSVQLADLPAGVATEASGTGASLTAAADVAGPITVTHLEQRPHGAPSAARAPAGYWIVNDYTDAAGQLTQLTLSAESVAHPGPTTALFARAANDTAHTQWRVAAGGALQQSGYTFDLSDAPFSGQYTFGTDAEFAIQLAAFSGDTLDREAHLSWSLEGVLTADTYTLEHRAPAAADFASRFTASAYGTVDSNLVDTGLVAGLHTYRLTLAGADGGVAYSNEIQLVIEEAPVVSGALSAAAFAKTLRVGPNPVRAGQALTFGLPEVGGGAVARVVLLDARGREQAQTSGPTGVDLQLNTTGLAAGTYFYRVEAAGKLVFGRVVVLGQ